jgi:hypothetical protein
VSANHDIPTTRSAADRLDSLQPLGSTTAMMVAGVLGVLGLGATLAGLAVDPHRTMISYLFAYAWCAALVLGSFFMLLIFTAAGARWFVVVKRGVEAMSSPMPLLAVLFLPILLFGKQIYSWMTPEALDKHGKEMLEAKAWWLNNTGFVGRAVIYFGLFILVQALLTSWSRRQDTEGSAALTRKMQKLATGILPLMALAYTAAALDWLMVIDITFTSTMFAVYYWAGGFIGALSLFVFVSANSHGEHSYTQLMKKDHWHNLGKLMLAFTVFWTYIAFSQMMLIWIANQPEEIPYYTVRMTGPWLGLFWTLIFAHFAVPFFTLLSRELKLHPQRLKWMALWIVAACMLDSFWMVMPTFYPAGPGAALHWTMFTAPLGIGGSLVAFALFRQRGRYAVPVGDPYLDDSLRYSQP